MRAGALIVAAGMSERMARFKQLMQIGNRTMAERVVVNFQQAGIEDIVMVTGYRSKQVEKELRNFGVTFLRNEQYETTQMFDSAKIGLEYFKDRCDKVLFCPVDIPFFTEKTVSALLKQAGDVVSPVHNGKSGHPILIQARLIPEILQYQGDGGLRCALRSIKSLKHVRVPVEDEAVVMDADTREDFQRLVDLHNARLMRPEVGVELVNQKPFFNQGTMILLRQIKRLGSVREACASSGISYSKGWDIIRSAEDGMGCRIVERQPGGQHGGKAAVTAKGERMMELFEEYEDRVRQAAEGIFEELFLNMHRFTTF